MIITSFDPVKGRGSELARLDLSPSYETIPHNLLWSISTDGMRLAVAPGPEGPIQIRSLRNQQTRVIRARDLNNMRYLQWAADGNGLLVSNVTNSGSELLHADLNGNVKVLWRSNSDRCSGVPSPDGRHLAIYEWKATANMWMMENF